MPYTTESLAVVRSAGRQKYFLANGSCQTTINLNHLRPSGTRVVVRQTGRPDVVVAELVATALGSVWRPLQARHRYGATQVSGGTRLLLAAGSGDGWTSQSEVLLETPAAPPAEAVPRRPA